MTHADEVRIIQNMDMLAMAKVLKMDIPSIFSDKILEEIREYQKVCAERAKFATKWLNA